MTAELKQMADAIGVAVRAGVVTQQTDDEKDFRKRAGLAEMSPEVIAKWEEDGGVRAPITIRKEEDIANTAGTPAPAGGKQNGN